MDTTAMTPALALALQARFGSVAAWHTRVMAPGHTSGNGAGWGLLLFNPQAGHLDIAWGPGPGDVPPGHTPLLAMDLRHPAPIDWAEVSTRYQATIHTTSEPWGVGADNMTGSQVLDVRRAGVVEQARTRLPGALWRDPATVDQWASELPVGVPITVYCVYGHEVSRATALRLRAAGRDARFLRGGIEAWAAAGHALEAWERPS